MQVSMYTKARCLAFFSVDVGSLCLFWHETHTKGVRVRLPTRPEEDRTEESREQDRPGQSTEQGSQQERAGVRACGLRGRVGQRDRMSQMSLMAMSGLEDWDSGGQPAGVLSQHSA